MPRPGTTSWADHLRGHLLRFDGSPASAYAERIGLRLLLIAGAVETLRVSALSIPGIDAWLLPPVLLGLALLLVPLAARVELSQLGFHRWRDWTLTEKSYFLQVLVIANVVFPVVLAAPLAERLAQYGVIRSAGTVFVPYLCFGFYQELVYRGMVQTELVRRWGVTAGILIANVLYTFGPLHWSYFTSPPSFALPMFAAIFAIGLFFGVLYRRSGNLWIVAGFHALGNAWIVLGVGPIG